MSTVVTRFAPSPTGYLHIGGARTALFNWLYARQMKGRFLLRVEDTDRARSTPEATKAIFDGLAWLGLDYDGAAESQFERRARHKEIAESLVEKGQGYRCFSTEEEIEDFREKAMKEGRPTLFESPWRDVPSAKHPDAPFVIRLKAPREGRIEIEDHVQGCVRWPMENFDDMVLLRSDGTPTYMLAVVVDDHDAGVTHVIRGDDHLINAARQSLIYEALGWDLPQYAHIPLIHGEDGKKLSKRHGALSVLEYRDMGYQPSAMRNYLARLGWAKGDLELFSTKEALEAFSLEGIKKSPARLDFKKLNHVSGYHIRSSEHETLMKDTRIYAQSEGLDWSEDQWARFARALPFLRDHAKKIGDLIEAAQFAIVSRPVPMTEEAQNKLDSVHNRILPELTALFRAANWEHASLFETTKTFAEAKGVKVAELVNPLRAALSGQVRTPSVFHMMEILGPDESLARINDILIQA